MSEHSLRRRRFTVAAALLAALPLVAAAQPDAQQLLSASDAIRNPERSFRATVTVTEFEKGAQVNSITLLSFARMAEGGGQFATLMRFTQPPRDAGKVMLKNGADLWFYDPTTKAAVRISPQQRLIGQAANGDVVTVNFARDYQARLAGEETITDGERKTRASQKLELKPTGDGAVYAAIELWIDAASKAPIKARFFADSGRLLKTAYYRKFQRQLGADRPTETVIIDGVDTQSVTLVRLGDYAARDLPAAWYQKEFLPRFNAE